jgi:hypothetical protein
VCVAQPMLYHANTHMFLPDHFQRPCHSPQFHSAQLVPVYVVLFVEHESLFTLPLWQRHTAGVRIFATTSDGPSLPCLVLGAPLGPTLPLCQHPCIVPPPTPFVPPPTTTTTTHPQTQLVYVAFDILFDEHESLITLPLRQRQQRLAQAVKCLPADAAAGVLLGPEGGCIRGRIVTLLPEVPLAVPVTGEVCVCGGGGVGVSGGIPAVRFSWGCCWGLRGASFGGASSPCCPRCLRLCL